MIDFRYGTSLNVKQNYDQTFVYIINRQIKFDTNSTSRTCKSKCRCTLSDTETPSTQRVIQMYQAPFFLLSFACLISLVSILGAIAIDISSWKSSLHAYGI
ncbi:hypothetical protein Hanom_Chr15g01354061 [Helianthus anomalus]